MIAMNLFCVIMRVHDRIIFYTVSRFYSFTMGRLALMLSDAIMCRIHEEIVFAYSIFAWWALLEMTG